MRLHSLTTIFAAYLNIIQFYSVHALSLGQRWERAVHSRDSAQIEQVLVEYYNLCSPALHESPSNSLIKRWERRFRKRKCNRFPVTLDDNFALRIAIAFNRDDIAMFLLKDPRVDPSAFDNGALIASTKSNKVPIVELILADPRVSPSLDDNIAAQITLHNCYSEATILLMTHPRFVMTANLYEWVKRSILTCNEPFLLSLASLQPPPFPLSFDNNFFLIRMATVGKTSVVEELIKHEDVVPSDRRNDALLQASVKGHTGVVRLLLNIPAVRYGDAGTIFLAFCSACSGGHEEMVQLFLEKEWFDPTGENDSALSIAFTRYHTNIVRLLLETGEFDLAVNDFRLFRQGDSTGSEGIMMEMLKRPELYHPFIWTEFTFESNSVEAYRNEFKLLSGQAFCKDRCSESVALAFGSWVQRYPFEMFHPSDADKNLAFMWQRFNKIFSIAQFQFLKSFYHPDYNSGKSGYGLAQQHFMSISTVKT